MELSISSGIGNFGVIANSNPKRNFLFLEVGDPVFTNEFTIGGKTVDLLFSTRTDYQMWMLLRSVPGIGALLSLVF